MDETNFNRCVDETLYCIEEAIDEAGFDIDYDTIAGILTLEFNDHSKIIINRQTAMQQLWVAARSGGFHLDYVDCKWFCKTENSYLNQLLDRLCSEQTQMEVNLKLE